MIKISEYKNQKVGVFGLGKAGEAAVASLVAGGAEVFAWDDSLSSESRIPNPESRIHYKDWNWNELKALILSPGVPLTHPKPHAVVELAHKHNVPIIGEMELLYRACPDATYIGITGTNGKSTTTTLIGHILEQAGVNYQVGGNLGTPALALEPLGKSGVYVIEMSSYQLDLLQTVKFNVAVLLNITPDHLDRHGDMAGYIAAKKHIFDRQTADDVAVIDVGIRQEALGSSGKIIEVSTSQELVKGIYVTDGILHDASSLLPNASCLMPISAITSLTGKHNWQNAAAAYAACRAIGVAAQQIYAAMQNFAGLRHRLQLVATINGVRFINDSKATNADATQNALAPYQNIYWIAGGKPKAGGIESLEPYFSHITHAFLIGEAADDFAKTLEGKVPYTHCGTLDIAVQKATNAVMPDGGFPHERSEWFWKTCDVASSTEEGLDASPKVYPRAGGGCHDNDSAVVLLSPACASFDQFKSFEHRGDVFCELVQKLAKDVIV